MQQAGGRESAGWLSGAAQVALQFVASLPIWHQLALCTDSVHRTLLVEAASKIDIAVKHHDSSFVSQASLVTYWLLHRLTSTGMLCIHSLHMCLSDAEIWFASHSELRLDNKRKVIDLYSLAGLLQLWLQWFLPQHSPHLAICSHVHVTALHR